MLCMTEVTVIARMIFPPLCRIVINLLQCIALALTINILYTGFKGLILKCRCGIINLSCMFVGGSIIHIPFRISTCQIVIVYIGQVSMSVAIIRHMTKAI